MEELTEGTDVDKMSLPQGWKWVKLSDVATVNPKLPNKDSLKDNLEIQFLPMRLVEEVIGKIHLTEVRKYSDVQKSYTSFVDGDVIFAKVTPCMENGKIAVVENLKNGIGFGSSEFHVIRPSAELNNKFLFNYLVQNAFRNGAKHEMTGAVGLRRVPKQFLENHLLPLPPPQEQRAIVSKIEELFSELDKGKQQLELAQQQLKVYRQAVLKWAFEGKLTNKDVKDGELPEGWSQVRVKDIAEIYGGYAFKSSEFESEGKYQVLRMGNVRPGILRYDENPVYLKKIEGSVLKRSLLKINDIIITQTGTRKKRDYGFTALISKENLLLNQRIAAIRCIEKYSPKFFLYFSWTDSFKDQFFANETGNVGQGNVGMKAVTETVIPYCSLSEQNQIVQEIESRLSVCDKVEETINQSLAKAETLRQSILRMAFEGKLVTEIESDNIRAVSRPLEVFPIAAQGLTRYTRATMEQFPKIIAGIKDTDLHAGILAMVIDAHEKSPEHHLKLSHIKGEKIAHLVEAYIGIDLGRTPRKDAAGPDDYPHLKKVESRATKAGWFRTEKLRIGQTYVSKSGMPKIIKRVKETLSTEDVNKIEKLIQTFLPFELEHAEVIATVYAGWNNLLLVGKTPTDEEIVFESRENWSKRKLSIERQVFFKSLEWMRRNQLIPVGKGKFVKSK